MASSDCLLSRAIPLPATGNVVAQRQQAKAYAVVVDDEDDGIIGTLAAKLDSAVTLGGGTRKAEKMPMAASCSASAAAANHAGAKERKKRAEGSHMSPADHLTLQSLRCSAMARKMNTTSKFSRDCRNLFTDLLQIGGGQQNQQQQAPAGEESMATKKMAAKKEEEAKQEEAEKMPPKLSIAEKKEKEEEKVENREKMSAERGAEQQQQQKLEKKKEETGKEEEEEQADQKQEKGKEEKAAAEKTTEKDDAENNKNGGGGNDDEEEGEEEDGQLIARGPVRANYYTGHSMVANAHPYHPYAVAGTPGATAQRHMASFNTTAAVTPQSGLLNANSLSAMHAGPGYAYECGLPPASNWSSGTGSSWSGGTGYDSAMSSPLSSAHSAASPDSVMGGSGGGGTLMMLMSPEGARSEVHSSCQGSELPDELSDFILEYSRRYSPTLSRKQSDAGSSSSGGGDGGTPRSAASSSGGNSPYGAGAGGGGDTPLCAPQSSPAAPIQSGEPETAAAAAAAGQTTTTMTVLNSDGTTTTIVLMAENGSGSRPAKERFRSIIRSEDMDDAWAWTCKCISRHPGALTFQDADRDTLLHIVTSHLDFAKIYALVEQMLKSELKMDGGMLPFDMPNGMGETPLMVAVQMGQNAVVDYLLEAGATPNAQSSRLERDMPLHYAATRGMVECVRTLCADRRTMLDAQNGMGLSPLLCAFKSHGVLEEGSQRPVCSLEVSELLLKAGANPCVVDATNGRTLLHYAVERLDERLIELLQAHMDEQSMATLVNQADFCGETPMGTLEAMPVIESNNEREESDGTVDGTNGSIGRFLLDRERRDRLCLTLLICGAAETGAEKTAAEAKQQ